MGKKSIVIISLIFLISLIGTTYAWDDMLVKRVNFLYEDVTVDEGMLLHLKLDNLMDEDIENIEISVGIPELGIVYNFGPLEFEDTYQRLLYVPLDGAEEGEYLVRISVWNNDNREVKHRYINIVG